MIKHIDVIVPCYNEESSLDRFWKESGEAFSAIEGYEFRYIFIDDGSSDETLQKIRRLAALQDSAKADASDAPGPDTILGATGDPAPGNPGAYPQVSYISFSRNFGKEAAMYAGLQASPAACGGNDPDRGRGWMRQLCCTAREPQGRTEDPKCFGESVL